MCDSVWAGGAGRGGSTSCFLEGKGTLDFVGFRGGKPLQSTLMICAHMGNHGSRGNAVALPSLQPYLVLVSMETGVARFIWQSLH